MNSNIQPSPSVLLSFLLCLKPLPSEKNIIICMFIHAKNRSQVMGAILCQHPPPKALLKPLNRAKVTQKSTLVSDHSSYNMLKGQHGIFPQQSKRITAFHSFNGTSYCKRVEVAHSFSFDFCFSDLKRKRRNSVIIFLKQLTAFEIISHDSSRSHMSNFRTTTSCLTQFLLLFTNRFLF